MLVAEDTETLINLVIAKIRNKRRQVETLPEINLYHLSRTDERRYGIFLFAFVEVLRASQQNQPQLSDQQIVDIIDANFSAFVLNHRCFGFEAMLLFKSLRSFARHEDDYSPFSRVILKDLVLTKALTSQQEQLSENVLALGAQKILYETLKQTQKSVSPRFFANLISINAFVALSTTILDTKTANDIGISHPFVLYVLSCLIYGDIFTNLLAKTFYRDSTEYIYVSLLTVVGAFAAKALVMSEDEMGKRAYKSLAVYFGVLAIACLVIKSPLYTRLLTKNRWYVDELAYLRGICASGQIFMAAMLPSFMRVIFAIFKLSDYDVSNNELAVFIIWLATIAVTQLGQFIYFNIKLPRYSRNCEEAEALQQLSLLQLYSIEKNKLSRSRQAENIWAVWGILYLQKVMENLQYIYPHHHWLAFIALFVVFVFGPRLGALWSMQVFSNTEIPKSVSLEYIQYLSSKMTYETTSCNYINQLLTRRDCLIRGIQSQAELMQQVEITGQKSYRIINHGEQCLALAISKVSLTVLVMFYIWDLTIIPFINRHDAVKQGTWPYLCLHVLGYLAISFMLSGMQLIISYLDRLETFLIEALALPTRLWRTVATLITAREFYTGKVLVAEEENYVKILKQRLKNDRDTVLRPVLPLYVMRNVAPLPAIALPHVIINIPAQPSPSFTY